MNYHASNSISHKAVSIITVFSMLLLAFSPAFVVHAAALTGTADTMSRLAVDELSDHAINFTTPTGVTSGQTIILTLPSDFDGTGLAFGDVDLFVDTTADGVCDGTAQTLVASGASSSQWNAVFSSTENRVLTLTSGGASATAAAGNEICVMVGTNASGGSAQYQNPSTPGTYSITIAAGADSGSVTVNIITNDQVSVSASVDQALSFVIDDDSIGFGTLSSSSAKYANGAGSGSGSETEAHIIAVGTNASGGYSLSVSGTTLTSGGDTIDAIGSSNTASSVGTEQFGIRANASGGAGTVSAPYADAGFAFDSAAFPDELASSTTASATTTYSMRYLANINANTEAGSYSATLTYLATANF